MGETPSVDKLALWDEVCETDKQYLKKIDRRGGFHAIDSHYQLHNATKLWGPYGTTWGIKAVEHKFLHDGDKTVGIILEAVFFYPGGHFPISTDMPYDPRGECCKKLMTDARSKALSLLGFNADVYFGAFDGNRYESDDSKPEVDRELGATTRGGNGLISDKQGKRLYAIAKGAGWEDDAMRKHLADTYGYRRSSEIPWKEYDKIVADYERGPVGGKEPAGNPYDKDEDVPF